MISRMPTFRRGLSYSCVGLRGPQAGKLSSTLFYFNLQRLIAGSKRIAACLKPHAMHRYVIFKHQPPAASPGGGMGISKTHLYEQLLAAGFTKQEIHSVIYKRILHEIACKNAYQQLPITGKIQYHIQHYSRQATRFCKRLTAKGLMLLKTQWAKKPKNPI